MEEQPDNSPPETETITPPLPAQTDSLATSPQATENQHSADNAEAPASSDAGSEELGWEASEYIHHHKPALWYIAFFGIGLLIAALLYFVLHDIIAIIVVIVMFAALFVYGVRKPQTLRYAITPDGMRVGEKLYLFSSFRSFSLAHDQGVPNITFIPLQRFALPLTIYFAPEDADKISEALSEHLPYEEHIPDMIDRLSHYLRF